MIKDPNTLAGASPSTTVADLSRRKALIGAVALAAPPALAAPITPDQGGARLDPFPAYHRGILRLHDAIEATNDEAEAEALMSRWAEIDCRAQIDRPTTFAGAVACLEYARREHLQFAFIGGEDSADPGDRLILSLLDGALAVLRTMGGSHV